MEQNNDLDRYFQAKKERLPFTAAYQASKLVKSGVVDTLPSGTKEEILLESSYMEYHFGRAKVVDFELDNKLDSLKYAARDFLISNGNSAGFNPDDSAKMLRQWAAKHGVSVERDIKEVYKNNDLIEKGGKAEINLDAKYRKNISNWMDVKANRAQWKYHNIGKEERMKSHDVYITARPVVVNAGNGQYFGAVTIHKNGGHHVNSSEVFPSDTVRDSMAIAVKDAEQAFENCKTVHNMSYISDARYSNKPVIDAARNKTYKGEIVSIDKVMVIQDVGPNFVRHNAIALIDAKKDLKIGSEVVIDYKIGSMAFVDSANRAVIKQKPSGESGAEMKMR